MTNTSIFLEGLVDLHRSTYFNNFNISGWDIDLDYHDIEWFALEMNRDHSVIFEISSSTAFWTLLLTMMATQFLLRNSCTQ